ncbi:MAG: hypothetical protein SPK72_07565 [Bacteroidales bacterium]|jgi:hypothetical protein|nr:hypothetical protein [Bacteroidales bacterium]
MKKLLAIAILMLTMVGCGVGTYSNTSGRSEKASISFVAAREYPIIVSVDGTDYSVNTVKLKAYRRDKRIKETAANTIYLTPGKHEIVVTSNGTEVKKDLIFLSNNESKVIEL